RLRLSSGGDRAAAAGAGAPRGGWLTAPDPVALPPRAEAMWRVASVPHDADAVRSVAQPPGGAAAFGGPPPGMFPTAQQRGPFTEAAAAFGGPPPGMAP